MKPPSRKGPSPAPIASPEVSPEHRALLAGSYKAGLILAWKRDVERGYYLAIAGRADAYVGLDQLSTYLERLRAVASTAAPAT